jgi:transcriptional regulator with XRE-family HTH domain
VFTAGEMRAHSSLKRRVEEQRRAIGREIRVLREDAGIPQARLAGAAGISPAHLCGIESGDSEASLAVLTALADALGASVSTRLYPGTGSRIRDHLQAAIVDAVQRQLEPRWKRFLEVPVYRPARGVIDIVLHDPAAGQIVAVEVHSEIRRLEQLLRWANEKREALPSAEIWQFAAVGGRPRLSSLLVLRSTLSTRALVGQHAATFAAAYPAQAATVWANLTGTAAWPGGGLIWASVRDGRATILDRPPRGWRLGASAGSPAGLADRSAQVAPGLAPA